MTVELADGYRLQPGNEYLLSRPTALHLIELKRTIEQQGSSSLLGLVFAGIRAPDAALAVPLAELVSIIEDSYEPRPPVVRLEVSEGTFTVVLENGNVPSTVATRENNYVEILISGGSFGRVDLGSFDRMGLPKGTGGRVARLFFRFVDSGQSVRSGSIELRGQNIRLAASVSLLGPMGSVVESEEVTWP